VLSFLLTTAKVVYLAYVYFSQKMQFFFFQYGQKHLKSLQILYFTCSLTLSSGGHWKRYKKVNFIFFAKRGANTSFSAPNWCLDCLTIESITYKPGTLYSGLHCNKTKISLKHNICLKYTGLVEVWISNVIYLLYELLYTLYNMFVKFNRLDCCPSQSSHFCFRYWRLDLVQRGQLKQIKIVLGLETKTKRGKFWNFSHFIVGTVGMISF